MAKSAKKTKWILLEYYNQYDQYGGYFAGVFNSLKDLKKSVDHLGRVDCEETWYEAKEYTIGVVIENEEDR